MTRGRLNFAGAWVAALAVLLLWNAPSRAELRIDITSGKVEPMPIAIPAFVGDQAGQQITQVISADLDRSGLFRPLDQKAFIEKITNINVAPQFGSWRAINAQALVAGQVQSQPDGRLRVDFRLWDVSGESQMIGQQYFTTPDNWRRIAHIIADAIYQR
ncbi:MAG: Tol-Pal system protein TolB, partial [Stellaceae bacterium]